MKMLRVNTFLGCIELETGGLIIGWLNVIGGFFGLFGVAVGLVFLSIYDCGNLRQIIGKTHKTAVDFDEDNCSIGRGVLIGLTFVAMAFLIGFLIIAGFFLKGLNRKSHIFVKPMMVLMAIVAVLSFVDIFSATILTIGEAVTDTIFWGYAFIVVYSIYKKFEDEFYKAPPVYYAAPIQKV